MENQDRLDELKKQWQNITVGEAGGATKLRVGRRLVSNLTRLRRFYRVMMIVSMLWVALFPLIMHDFFTPVWLSAYGSIFFAVMAFFLWRVYYELNCIDFSEMSVVAVMRSICVVERMRIWHLIAGTIIGLPLIVVMLVYFARIDEAVMWGGIVGGVVGIVIGVMNLIRTARWLKSIKAELASVAE